METFSGIFSIWHSQVFPTIGQTATARIFRSQCQFMKHSGYIGGGPSLLYSANALAAFGEFSTAA